MVEVRLILVLDVFVVFFSLGAIWISVGSHQSQVATGYNGFDVASMVGGYIRGQQTNPPSYQESSFAAFTQSVLPPLIMGNWGLVVALVSVPAALVLALASLSRWQLALPAGILGVAGSALWIGEIPAIAGEAGSRLAAWQGFVRRASPIPVGPSLGPYLALAGGTLLLFTYAMTRVGRFDTPLDSTIPSSTTPESGDVRSESLKIRL